jgi:hypothetical protein
MTPFFVGAATVFSALQLSAVALWAKDEVKAKAVTGKEGIVKAVLLHCLICYIYEEKELFKLSEPTFKALEGYIGKRKFNSDPEEESSPPKKSKKRHSKKGKDNDSSSEDEMELSSQTDNSSNNKQ